MNKLSRNLFTSTLIMICFLSTLPSLMRIEEANAEIQYVSIVPIDDARVYEGTPDANFGSQNFMTVGRYWSNHIEMWIRFNLTDVALAYDSLKLKSAGLKLRGKGTLGTLANVQVQVWVAQAGWSESSITWNTKPPLLTNYTLCAFTGDVFSELDYRRVALNKSDVEYWMSSNDKLYSICLTARNQSDTDAFLQVST
ncbi:DNRLRE domain-containing protein, partial [candidate division WOR-3 bacterium]|nr:DNRLRE domain-containing protein [candidate division WOR-3 bacterium]